MQNLLEDFYIPIRGNDVSTKIETAPGLQYDGIQDVTYLRDKLFAALKVPKAFMGYEKDLTGKATLAAEDIRFARTINRIQRIVLSELYKIALVHLYTQGYTGEQLTNFELELTTPSIIYDQEKIALLTQKVDLAQKIMESKLLPTDWIYDNIFHFSEDQYDEYRDLIVEDQKRAFRRNQIAEEGYDSKMGARPLARKIDELVRVPLSKKILFERVKNARAPLSYMFSLSKNPFTSPNLSTYLF